MTNRWPPPEEPAGWAVPLHQPRVRSIAGLAKALLVLSAGVLVLLNITVRIALSSGGNNQGVYPGLEIAVAVVSLAARVPVARVLTAEQDRLAATRLA
jgi:divalent metal cation (Fe/Co/Zn/Cd) transporter